MNTKIYSFKFNTYNSARNFADRAFKAMLVMNGDNGLFWVVTLADAARLMKLGYTVA